MLMLFGWIRLPLRRPLETTRSLHFLLHSPERTLSASLSLGSAARQPTDNLPLVMLPCLTAHPGGRMTEVGERTALKQGGYKWSG